MLSNDFEPEFKGEFLHFEKFFNAIFYLTDTLKDWKFIKNASIIAALSQLLSIAFVLKMNKKNRKSERIYLASED